MSGQFAHRLYPLGDRELTLLKLWISVWYSVKPWFVSFFVLGVAAELAKNGSSPFRVSMMWLEITDQTWKPQGCYPLPLGRHLSEPMSPKDRRLLRLFRAREPTEGSAVYLLHRS